MYSYVWEVKRQVIDGIGDWTLYYSKIPTLIVKSRVIAAEPSQRHILTRSLHYSKVKQKHFPLEDVTISGE
jgi:hypothetical protein